MKNNPGYFNYLVEDFPSDIPSIFENQIEMDLKRSFQNEFYFKDPHNIQSLKVILLAFSRRNSSIGYCQGFNFIVGRLLKVFEFELNKEEKVFWIFCQLVESILPLNYYTDLIGIMVYQKLFEKFLNFYHKDIIKILENASLTLETLTTQWFVSLFSLNFQEDIVNTIWDVLFIDGSKVIFKTGLGVFTLMKPQIVKLKTLEDIFFFFDSNIKKIDCHEIITYFTMIHSYDFDDEFINNSSKKLEKDILFKMSESALKVKAIFEKTKEKSLKSSYNFNTCDTKWPICKFDDQNFDKSFHGYYIYKSIDYSFDIIDDYFTSKNRGNKLNLKPAKLNYDNLLIERKEHICLKLSNESTKMYSKENSDINTKNENVPFTQNENFFEKLNNTYRQINFLNENEIALNLEARASRIMNNNSLSIS